MRPAQADRQEQILRATCEVVADQGFRAMRVSDVAKHIGTASGTIHYHFPTKRDLLHAAFEYNFRDSLARRAKILETDHDPVVKLRELIDSYIPTGDAETMRAWRVWAELWIEAIHDPDLQSLNETVYGEWRALMARILRDGQAAGVISSGDAATQANMLIGLLDGLAIQVVLGSQSMDTERMRRVCHAFIDQIVASD